MESENKKELVKAIFSEVSQGMIEREDFIEVILKKSNLQEINQVLAIAQNKGLETVIDYYAHRAGIYLS